MMPIYDNITEQQKLVLAIVPRICASISAGCAIYMMVTILKSSYCRGRTYHRLMVGTAVPILILNMATLWGQTAAPVEGGVSDHVMGARGNTTTCTVQGFLYQFKLVNSSYYAVLSLLTWRLVNNKVRTQLDRSWEICIHIGVYIFPVMSGLYFISIDAFNMLTLGCGVASMPLGCGDQSPSSSLDDDDTYIECIRGPQNIGFIQWVFVGIPSVMIALFPAILILSLFFKLLLCSADRKRNPSNARKIAFRVANQGVLYLSPLYVTYLFRYLDAAMVVGQQKYVFEANLVAEIFEPLTGLWTLLVYNYFRSKDVNCDPNSPASSSTHEAENSGSGPSFSIFDGSNVVNSNSPWAAFLLDEGEDSSYNQGGSEDEYSDGDFQGLNCHHQQELVVVMEDCLEEGEGRLVTKIEEQKEHALPHPDKLNVIVDDQSCGTNETIDA